MDATSIELRGSRVDAVHVDDDRVRVLFAPAYLVKTMTGSAERTRWRQDGELIFERAQVVTDPPALPAVCAGGDVTENIYTYRDMVPVPLASRGRIACELAFDGTDARLAIVAGAVRLEMAGVPKYIKHVRP